MISDIQEYFSSGKVILINKEKNRTSFDVIRKLRHVIHIKKIGHAGTLDPLATGLLIVCTGSFTKKLNEFMGLEKEYTGTITLGAETKTFDLESEPINQKDITSLDSESINAATKQFTGNIMQMPPVHSAIKQAGKPVYLAARKGLEVKMEARAVSISEFTISKIALPIVSFKVVCSTGTYIRSLANDFGAALGVGGHLSSLCRTRIGSYQLKDAMTVDEFTRKYFTKTDNLSQ